MRIWKYWMFSGRAWQSPEVVTEVSPPARLDIGFPSFLPGGGGCGCGCGVREDTTTTATTNHHLETPGTLSSVPSSAQCRPCEHNRDTVYWTPTSNHTSHISHLDHNIGYYYGKLLKMENSKNIVQPILQYQEVISRISSIQDKIILCKWGWWQDFKD